MIGLKRDTVILVDHDPDWDTLAAERCKAIRDACAEFVVDVQHIGSTAVPELPAKPILDIVAGVLSLDSIPVLIRCLADIGYTYRTNHGDAGGHLFVLDSSPGIRAIHLHVVEHRDSQWRNYIAFRDLLRDQPGIREHYAELKRELAKLYPTDRETYAAGKTDFIRNALNGV
jgi:GrpB-like predicted nucleotidyltransferase (UPF0157 family)